MQNYVITLIPYQTVAQKSTLMKMAEIETRTSPWSSDYMSCYRSQD